MPSSTLQRAAERLLSRSFLALAALLLLCGDAPAGGPPVQLAQAGSGSCGDSEITVVPLAGGRTLFSVNDPCRAGQAVSFTYAGIPFQRALDAQGRLDFTLDCFAGDGTPVAIAFQDGSTFTRNAVARDMNRVSKISVLWSAPVNLDLHAFEYAANFGKLGHVWAGAPSSPDMAKQNGRDEGRGRGFMGFKSDGRNGANHLEVYTFWHHRRETSGVVRLALDYESRGFTPNGETCGSGRFAEVAFLVLKFSNGGQFKRSEGAFEAAACGTALSEQARYNDKAIPDLFLGK